jgi:hypothetical protein
MEHQVHCILYEEMFHSDTWSILGWFGKNSIKVSWRIPHGIPLWLPRVYEVQGLCPRGPGNLSGHPVCTGLLTPLHTGSNVNSLDTPCTRGHCPPCTRGLSLALGVSWWSPLDNLKGWHSWDHKDQGLGRIIEEKNSSHGFQDNIIVSPCWLLVYHVLKQATRVKNSLCLSSGCDGAFWRASDDQYNVNGETWYGHEWVFGDLVMNKLSEMKYS